MPARIGHDWRSSGDQGFDGIGGRRRRSCRSGMLLPDNSAMAAGILLPTAADICVARLTPFDGREQLVSAD